MLRVYQRLFSQSDLDACKFEFQLQVKRKSPWCLSKSLQKKVSSFQQLLLWTLLTIVVEIWDVQSWCSKQPNWRQISCKHLLKFQDLTTKPLYAILLVRFSGNNHQWNSDKSEVRFTNFWPKEFLLIWSSRQLSGNSWKMSKASQLCLSQSNQRYSNSLSCLSWDAEMVPKQSFTWRHFWPESWLCIRVTKSVLARPDDRPITTYSRIYFLFTFHP